MQRLVRIKGVFIVFFLALQFCTCKNSHSGDSISFYYWKTNYHLNSFEKSYLLKHDVKNIYLRCFDVVLDNNEPKPDGVLIWKDEPIKGITYIPTIPIMNEVFNKSDSNYLHKTADKIYQLSTQIFKARHLPINEIQIDCDWTESTRDAYFQFLSYLKKKDLVVSNTLRLFQYKYRKQSGIAPCDYTSLMCYNMGSLKNVKTENSILNHKDLVSYLEPGNYPKPLRIALPIFNWTLVFHDKTFKGILYNQPDTNNGHWLKQSATTFLCSQDYYDLSCRQEFLQNDLIRVENLSPQDLINAKQLIYQKLNLSKYDIIYFDLDSAKMHRCLP